MSEVGVVGVGITKFGVRSDASLRELAFEAVKDALEHCNLTIKDVDALVCGVWSDEASKAASPSLQIADYLGILPKPSYRVEAACATGSAAIRSAWALIKSGIHDIVLVVGVEKMTEHITSEMVEIIGKTGDVFWEYPFGITFPGYYALMARAHMKEFGTTREQLAMVAVKNHRNAINNPIAHFRKEISIDTVLTSKMISDPLTLYDCSPITDGAAAVVLASAEKAKKITDVPIWLCGLGAASDHHSILNRRRLTGIDAVIYASREAYRMAKIEPKDVDVAEVHDCFTIAEIIAYEDLGFCEEGRGGKLVEDGETEINGRIPVNVDGGLKAKGHPIGATGVAQVVEIVKQLRGEAQGRQVSGAKIGLTHNVGATGQSVYVHIYRR